MKSFILQARQNLANLEQDFKAQDKILKSELPLLYEGRIEYFQPCLEALIKAQVQNLTKISNPFNSFLYVYLIIALYYAIYISKNLNLEMACLFDSMLAQKNINSNNKQHDNLVNFLVLLKKLFFFIC